MSCVGVDGPSDWPSEFSQLKHIDSLLRCSICFEFLNIAMIVPSCSHNYCSYCIRKHIYGKESCPTCHVPLIGGSGELKCNRILDELVSYFKPVRERLINVLRDYLNLNQSGKQNTENKSGKGKKGKIENAKIVYDGDSEFQDLPSFRCPNNSLDKSRVISEKTKQPEKEKGVCPSCNKDVPIDAMNLHLDVCLRDENSTNRPSLESNQKMKPIPACCLDALEYSELKSKAKKYGLPLNGDRKQLMKRIENFILLYNSQCDSLTPMAVSQIVKQVCESEQKMLKHGYTPGILIHTHDNRYTIDEKEEFNKKYGLANEKQFKNLIDEVKEKENCELIEIKDCAPHDNSGKIDKPESRFGHVPDWFDKDLLQENTVKKGHDRLKEIGKSKKPKKSTNNKKNSVKSVNITSYFTQNKNVDRNKSKNKTVGQPVVDLTTTGSPLIIDDSGDQGDGKQPDILSPSLSLCEDTDDTESIDSDDEMIPCASKKIPVIYETDTEDEIVCESPLKIQEDHVHESASVKRELLYNVTDRLNSTAVAKDSLIEDFSIPLSPVSKKGESLKRKRRQTPHGSGNIKETVSDNLDNSQDSHSSELSGEINKLIEQVIEDPLCFSDSDDGNSNNLASDENFLNPPRDAIPPPPNDDVSFEID